jgi:hypothetical protein
MPTTGMANLQHSIASGQVGRMGPNTRITEGTISL